MPVKRCSWGTCSSDNRHPLPNQRNRLKNAFVGSKHLQTSILFPAPPPPGHRQLPKHLLNPRPSRLHKLINQIQVPMMPVFSFPPQETTPCSIRLEVNYLDPLRVKIVPLSGNMARAKVYTATVQACDDEGLEAHFMHLSENHYVWSDMDDMSFVFDNEIVEILPVLLNDGRGRHFFPLV